MSAPDPAEPRLSRRLQQIAQLVLPGRDMADVGTDHALLPCHLVYRGRVPRAIASDRQLGPLSVARANVERYRLAPRVVLRHGDGLAPLAGESLGSLVIAGMGGHRVATIMEGDTQPNAERLIIQANGGLVGLRRRVYAVGWRLVDEWLFEDRGTATSLMLWLRPGTRWAEPGSTPGPADQLPAPDYSPERDAPRVGHESTWQDVDWLLGPQLRRRGGNFYRAWLADEYEKLCHHWAQAKAGQNNKWPEMGARARESEHDDRLAPELRHRLSLYEAEIRRLERRG